MLAVGLVVLLGSLHVHHRVHEWFIWRYAQYLLCSALFSAACLSSGHVLLRRVAKVYLPVVEHVTVAFALGVLAFFWATFVFGLLGLFGKIFFFAMPLALTASGARPLYRYIKRYHRHAAARGIGLGKLIRGREVPLLAAGLVGLVLLYLPLLSPQHIGYDSLWYHLPIAEQYAAAGRIHRFDEGWYPGTGPHLASVLFAWAFQLPFSLLYDRMELCAHLEMTLFVWLLPGVPALVSRVVPGLRSSAAWVSLFLFPFVRACALTTGADQAAALFVIPSFLLLLRAYPSLDLRYAVLLSAALSGSLLTKHSAVAVAVFPVAAVAARAVVLLVRRARGREGAAWPVGALAALGAGLVFTSAFWLKNWVWYGNPIYPMANQLFRSRPWNPDAGRILADWLRVELVSPKRDLAGLLESLTAMVRFSFEPFDMAPLTNGAPAFGALLTLFLPCLLVVRANRRLWALVAACHVSVFVWYWIHRQERYLLVPLPLFMAATSAAIVLIWRAAWPARAALAVLLTVQAAWVAEVYIATFDALGAFTNFLELAKGAFRPAARQRLAVGSPWREVGQALPQNAKVLVHENHVHLGLKAPSVSDFTQWQGGINYGRLGSAPAVYGLLGSMGVTHLAYQPASKGYDSLAGDLVFYSFASRYAVGPRSISGLTLAAMPAAPPPAEAGDTVAVLACPGSYRPGLYHLSDLAVPSFAPLPPSAFPPPFEPLAALPASEATVLARATFLVHDPACGGPLPASLQRSFVTLTSRHSLTLRMRN